MLLPILSCNYKNVVWMIIDKPAEMNSAVLQAVKMVCTRTESLAKFTGERTTSSATLVLVMVHVTVVHNMLHMS